MRNVLPLPGHDGTWSMQVEHFEDSLRWGRKAADGITPEVGEACSGGCSDCALAALRSGEDQEIEIERARLASVDALQGAARTAEELLYGGDDSARDRLMPLVYHELRRLAHRELRREGGGHTLESRDLLHEAYVRLIDADVPWSDRAHFFAVAARTMRRVLVDHARARRSLKRRPKGERVALDDVVPRPLAAERPHHVREGGEQRGLDRRDGAYGDQAPGRVARRRDAVERALGLEQGDDVLGRVGVADVDHAPGPLLERGDPVDPRVARAVLDVPGQRQEPERALRIPDLLQDADRLGLRSPLRCGPAVAGREEQARGGEERRRVRGAGRGYSPPGRADGQVGSRVRICAIRIGRNVIAIASMATTLVTGFARGRNRIEKM